MKIVLVSKGEQNLLNNKAIALRYYIIKTSAIYRK